MCGDTHGQFYDLLNIFETFGYPSETNPYLFNGETSTPTRVRVTPPSETTP